MNIMIYAHAVPHLGFSAEEFPAEACGSYVRETYGRPQSKTLYVIHHP